MKHEIRFPSTTEKEATLIICSEEPEVVASKILDLTSVGSYHLLPQESKKIHDYYFDTPDSALEAKKLALRVRGIKALHWIALKGPSRPTRWGGVERLEIEERWSKETLTTIVKELMNKRIKMQGLPQYFDRADSLDVMASLGLKVVQDRETLRQIRNVVALDNDDSSIFGEMAIDSVTYTFGKQKILHYEVELESKMRDGANVVKAVTENLVKMFTPALRRRNYGKLATGKAIEKLLDEGALEGLVDGENRLKPGAYDKIDEYLKKDKV